MATSYLNPSTPNPSTPEPSTRLPSLRRWWIASRPRTLTMAVTPVLVGTALAWSGGWPKNWLVFLLTLPCAILIQVATNLLNDVSDFDRGDGSGAGKPRGGSTCSPIVLTMAGAIGSLLVWIGGPAILALGVFSIVAGSQADARSRPCWGMSGPG